jgi:alpha-aminoadipic semialdehyde synthase
MNCIYWAPQYPKFVTKEGLKKLYTKTHMLRVIGDISCDIEGAVECTLYATNPGAPVFVYNPFTQTTTPGVEGTGPVVLSVDNLPCELPKDSSIHFSSILKDFVPDIVNADFKVKFEDCNLRQEIKDAIIVYQGLLTPKYKYLEKYL